MTRRILWLLVGLMLVASACASDDAAPVGAEVAAAIAETPQDGAPQEGIRVHGHWTISVVNPDGSLASEVEFENALLPSGSLSLLQLLTGRFSTNGGWLIDTVLPSTGRVTEASLDSSTPGGVLVISQSETATADTTISNVVTSLQTCVNTVSPVNCVPNDVKAITATTISPIEILANQTVYFEVRITFS